MYCCSSIGLFRMDPPVWSRERPPEPTPELGRLDDRGNGGASRSWGSWAAGLRHPTTDIRTHVSSAVPPPGVRSKRMSPCHFARRPPVAVRRTRRHWKQLLYALPLDVATPAQPLANTDGASLPFWSPDSHSVGFFGQGKLKTVDVATGQVRTLADAGQARGGTWNRDDVILFAPRPATGLTAYPRRGASPRR